MTRAILHLVTVVAVAALAACAPMPPSPPDRPSPPPQTEEPRPAPERPPEQTDDRRQPSPAVQSLLDQGWALYRQQEYQRALAHAERAQRIDARSPEVYLLMASAQFSLSKLALAEQLARRGLAMSASGSQVYRQLEALMTRITALP